MRRWFFVLLLVFMPLQFSWAALATYCEHESGAQARHLGHHEHEHHANASDDATQAKASAVFDVDDCHCHCQCMAALPLSTATPLVIGSLQATAWTGVRELAPVLSPPERPQWVGHA